MKLFASLCLTGLIAFFWFGFALTIQADAIDPQDDRVRDQLIVAGIGSCIVLATNVAAWMDRWALWGAGLGFSLIVLVAWYAVAEPIGLA